jgi:hypothetical protein
MWWCRPKSISHRAPMFRKSNPTGPKAPVSAGNGRGSPTERFAARLPRRRFKRRGRRPHRAGATCRTRDQFS